MAFHNLPFWAKVALVGSGVAVTAAAVKYGVVPLQASAHQISAEIPQADKKTQDLLKEALELLQEAKECKSLLKKHFTKQVLDLCGTRKTVMGATLWDVIQSGVKNLDSTVGIYAPDPESYRTFRELFDPIIQDYHGGFSPNDVQPTVDLGEKKLSYFNSLDPDGKYIQSTRIRCGRSIKGFPFNPILRENEYLDLELRISSALQTFEDAELQGTYYPLLGTSKETLQQLVNDHFLFKEHNRFLEEAQACRFWPMGRGIFHNKDKTFLAWVNEEDHLRIISMQQGGNVRQVLDRLIRALKEIEGKLSFARDERLGFLTFCPTNLGTTIRASVHIKLPKLAANRKLKKLCDSLNLQIRGVDGEDAASLEDGIYEISNKQRLGITEFEAVKQMYDGVRLLIQKESKLNR